MNRFQLFLDTVSPELFSKATCELGTIFYRKQQCDTMKEKQPFEIVYFSGSRVARFVGVPTEKIVQLCLTCGFEVSEIQLDEVAGTVRIIQKKET